MGTEPGTRKGCHYARSSTIAARRKKVHHTLMSYMGCFLTVK
jgi:hypothetical protein